MTKLALVTASLLCAAPALADEFQPKVGRFEVGAYGGVGFLSGRHSHYSVADGLNVPFDGTALGGGLRVAFFWPCRYTGIELEADGLFGSLTNDDSASLIGLRGHLILQGEGDVAPFFLAGVGGVMVSGDPLGSDEDPAFNLGVGVKLYLGDMLAVRVEARDSLTEGEMPDTLAGTVAHHIQFLVGVSVAFLGS